MLPVLAVALAVLVQLGAAPPPHRPGVKVRFVPLPSQTRSGVAILHVTPTPKQVLCTMPMLRPQTNVDPQIVVEPPKNGAKIRTLDVPVCIERASR